MTDNKKKKFSIRKLIYNDKYLIIFSVFAAIVIWVIASMSLSPETTKTITVPVKVDFSNSAAAQLGINCYGDESFDVDVTFSCKKYLVKDITPESFDISLQTNVVTGKGNLEVPIKVESNNSDLSIKSFYPTIYKGYFDLEDTKTLDIEIEYSNDDFIADGYIMGEELLSESTGVVKGPKSYVSTVKRLVATATFEDKLTQTQSVDLKVNALDSYGNAVDYVTVDTGSDNFNLTVPVLKEKELNVTTSFINAPTDIDMSKIIVQYSQEKVNAGVLDENMNEANIGDIDFSRLRQGNNEFKFDVTTLEGVVILDNIKTITAKVIVPTTYSSKAVKISADDINITNIPDDYDIKVTGLSLQAITVIGDSEEINDMNNKELVIVADISGNKDELKEGTVQQKLSITFANSKKCWVYGDYFATLEVKSK